MSTEKRTIRDIRPDAQAFDEVRLVTIPRYKQSGMSGDEWRISVNVQFYRKGRLIAEERISNKMESACAFLAYRYEMQDGAYFAGESDYCDQEGCCDKSVVTLLKKYDYCRQGHKTEDTIYNKVRKFCEKHRVRGDCGLDDADRNYEVIE